MDFDGGTGQISRLWVDAEEICIRGGDEQEAVLTRTHWKEGKVHVL